MLFEWVFKFIRYLFWQGTNINKDFGLVGSVTKIFDQKVMKFKNRHFILIIFYLCQTFEILSEGKIRFTWNIKENRIMSCSFTKNNLFSKMKEIIFKISVVLMSVLWNRMILDQWLSDQLLISLVLFKYFQDIAKVKNIFLLFPQPNICFNYNNGMGGVEIMYKAVSCYWIFVT